MSLQPSSQPEARSLIVFLLSVLSPLLTQFTDFQDKVRDLPRVDVVQGVRIRAQGPRPGQTGIRLPAPTFKTTTSRTK